jgi:hypothetical protein
MLAMPAGSPEAPFVMSERIDESRPLSWLSPNSAPWVGSLALGLVDSWVWMAPRAAL